VVLGVGDLPGEVRDKQRGVCEPANGIVERLGGRERLVAALVCHDPKAGSENALQDGVSSPQDGPCRGGGNHLGCDEVIEQIEGGGERSHVAANEVEALDGGALEAVGWDSITDLLDSVVGDLELVAVCVEKFAMAGLEVSSVIRAE
jgi:hypothetical protein